MIGCGVAFTVDQLGMFGSLVVSMVVGNTSSLQNGFVATDLADEDKQARSIAMVVWAGTVGAVVGSPSALWANRVGTGLVVKEWVSPTLLGALAGLIINTALRPDPLRST